MPFLSRVRSLVSLPNRRRADQLVAQILPWLNREDRIVDIGSGAGLIADSLMRQHFDVTMLDVADISMIPNIRATLYDGKRMPFENDAFDIALLITVLHHIADPDATLREAMRVAKRIVVLEDLVENMREARATYFADSWLNWQWFDHPHSNRSDAEWRATFSQLGLRIVHAEQSTHAFFPFRFRHGLFVLESF
jgi:ubiquinone/menaquinone biosynthesis C-methylase UbiE